MEFQDYNSGSSLKCAIIIVVNMQIAYSIHMQAYECDLRILNAQIKSTIEDLNNFKPFMDCLGTANNVGGMFIEFGKAIGGVNHC